MTPSDLLLAAADRIRDLAAAATPGPWANGSNQTVVTILPTGLTRYLPTQRWGLKVASKVDDVDRAWISALSPAVAPHLEAILREAAGTCSRALADGWTEERVVAEADDAMLAALSLARLLCPELVEEDQK